MPNLRTESNSQDPRSLGIHTHKHTYTDKQASVSTQKIYKNGKCNYSHGMELMHACQAVHTASIALNVQHMPDITASLSFAPLSRFLTLNAGRTLRGSDSRPPVSWNDPCEKSWTGGRDLPQITTAYQIINSYSEKAIGPSAFPNDIWVHNCVFKTHIHNLISNLLFIFKFLGIYNCIGNLKN